MITASLFQAVRCVYASLIFVLVFTLSLQGQGTSTAQQQSQIDELTSQLESTKAALDDLQKLNAKLDAANVELARELNSYKPVAAEPA